MSVEWSEDGVRVNAVAPGIIFSQTAADNYAVDVFEMARPEIPAKRLGTPEEVSSAVCFLLSPGASFINGATLRVDAAGSHYSKLMKVIPGSIKVAKFHSTTKACRKNVFRFPEHDKSPPYNWQSAREDDQKDPKPKL